MAEFLGNGLRSQAPDGWADRSTLTLVGPTAQDGFAANIVVTRQVLPIPMDAPTFGRNDLAALRNEVEELRVDDERTVRLRGRLVFQRLHAVRMGPRWVQQLQTYLVRPSRDRTSPIEGFVITASASPEAFGEQVANFRLFTESFEFTDV